MLTNSLSFYDFFLFQKFNWFFFTMIPIGIMWIISCLAETNRTPFDFAEWESELVSGFNIEFSSYLFAFIFLAEYFSIIFISMLTIMFMFGGNFYSLFFFKLGLYVFFIWIRGTLPRFRYDKLMYMNWKFFLPIKILLSCFYFSISILMKMMI